MLPSTGKAAARSGRQPRYISRCAPSQRADIRLSVVKQPAAVAGTLFSTTHGMPGQAAAAQATMGSKS